MMTQRPMTLLLAGLILCLDSAVQSAMAYIDRGVSATITQLPLSAQATLGPHFRAAETPPADPRYSRQHFAHAIIVRTSPERGAVAPENLQKVEVWYDAGIRSDFAALAVINASGERVDKRDAAIDTLDPSHVSVTTDPLRPGEYSVRYRALSADGHIVSGSWAFEIRGQ